MKKCSRCGEEKSLSEFSRQTLGKHGRRADCKNCQRIYNQAWKAANKQRTAATRRERYLRRRDELLAYNREWNRTHRGACDRATDEWRKRNPEKLKAQKFRRWLREATAPGNDYTTTSMILQRIEVYGGRCYYCRMDADTIDHRIPLSRGGSHLPANLVPACRSCNSRKRSLTEREFVSLYRKEVKPSPHESHLPSHL